MKKITLNLFVIIVITLISSCGSGKHKIEGKVWTSERGDLVSFNDGIFRDLNSGEKAYELNDEGTEITTGDNTLVIVSVDDKILKLKKKGESDIETFHIAKESDLLKGRWKGEDLNGKDVFFKIYFTMGGDKKLRLKIDREEIVDAKCRIDGNTIKSGGEEFEFKMDGYDNLFLTHKGDKIELYRD